MRVFTRRPFREAERKYPQNRESIRDVLKTLEKGIYKTPDDLKNAFPSLDNFKYKDKWYVIDIGGNNLRLIALIVFENHSFFVRHIVTHAEYDKLCKRYKKGDL
jgi:mRNA interferase HigB